VTETYQTYECTHKTLQRDANGYICPRYCGEGYPVTRVAPRLYERTWQAADESKAAASEKRASPLRDEAGVTTETTTTVPPPEVRARLAVPGEIPPSAIRLELLARTQGFRTAVTYARGTAGRTVRDSILARGQHADGRAFGAHWLDGTADPHARKVRHPDGRVTDLSARELTAWLQSANGDEALHGGQPRT
jgi:hypothetical protein